MINTGIHCEQKPEWKKKWIMDIIHGTAFEIIGTDTEKMFNKNEASGNERLKRDNRWLEETPAEKLKDVDDIEMTELCMEIQRKYSPKPWKFKEWSM